jgi:hypothetical protein
MTTRKDFKSLTNRYYASWSKTDVDWSVETPAQLYAKDFVDLSLPSLNLSIS